MGVHNAIRKNPLAQPQRQRPDHQLKAEIFETLRHLNRGYGVALAALDRIESKDRHRTPRIFPAGFLGDYRNRTESLRALANHDVLLLIAGREQQEAERFSRLRQSQKPASSRRS